MSTLAAALGPVRLFFSPFCPYAQRVTLSLHLVGAIASIAPGHAAPNVELVEIDLHNKPDYFVRDINRAGSVPVIVLPALNNLTLVESAPLARFVLRAASSPLVSSPAPLDDFRAHLLIDAFSAAFPPNFYALLKTNAPDAAPKLLELFAKLNKMLVDAHAASNRDMTPTTTFATGSGAPSIAEVLCAPFLQRLEPLARLRGFRVPTEPEAQYGAFHMWLSSCAQHASVRATTPSVDALTQFMQHLMQK